MWNISVQWVSLGFLSALWVMQSKLWEHNLDLGWLKASVWKYQMEGWQVPKQIHFHNVHDFQASWPEWHVSQESWCKNIVLCLKIALLSSQQGPGWSGLRQTVRRRDAFVISRRRDAFVTRGPLVAKDTSGHAAPTVEYNSCGTDCGNMWQHQEIWRRYSLTQHLLEPGRVLVTISTWALYCE